MLFHGETDGGFVHDGDVGVGEGVGVGYFVKLAGVGKFHRVFVVDAVDFCCFYDNITLHFECEIEGSGVGGQEWSSSATTYDDDATFGQVTQCAAVGVLVDKLIDLDG